MAQAHIDDQTASITSHSARLFWLFWASTLSRKGTAVTAVAMDLIRAVLWFSPVRGAREPA